MRKFFASLASVFVVLQTARALPVERFSEAINLSCSSGEVCGFSTRSKTSLGGRLGIAVTAGDRGTARVRTRGSGDQRALEVSVPKVGVGMLNLSWDGDPHPHQLSSGGLGCLNLRADGAIALKIEPFEVRATCEGDESGPQCKPVMIETRVYDPSDPTGQRYSASILRRKIPRRGSALEIPFSNFIHKGPRGAASFECVGAISVSIEVEGQRGLSMELGAIQTEGRRAPAAVDTATPPRVAAEASPTVSATSTRAIVPSPTVVVARATNTARASPTVTPRPAKTSVRPASSVATSAPAPTRPPLPSAAPSTPPPLSERPEPAEAVVERLFGEVIAPPAISTPSDEKKRRRQLWD